MNEGRPLGLDEMEIFLRKRGPKKNGMHGGGMVWKGVLSVTVSEASR